MQMTLADGRTQTTEILTTSVDIGTQEKVIATELIILKNAKGNRTLLGIDFLTTAGIILDLQRKQWYFTETSHRKYNFVKAPPNINALLTVDTEPHPCQLRENEDLRAGYHQVKVHAEDQDKTAFVCPFGTYRYLRMPYDASNYALGAVLLQGEGSDEHPIEYASRLLTPAERNYSTTEREALAVVWALKKFRGYIEEMEITVASDHKPLKWLLNLKSPTGQPARWALEIQSFNLKVQYIPGKANVVADMLSPPVTQEEESF
ncbi:retrovirus-related Pol polyprotein from transposon 297 [Trichonephila clavipes]|nr:retrovirus-related Pol polyprotein from transposon 297 [Trichonephila clavipes]